MYKNWKKKLYSSSNNCASRMHIKPIQPYHSNHHKGKIKLWKTFGYVKQTKKRNKFTKNILHVCMHETIEVYQHRDQQILN